MPMVMPCRSDYKFHLGALLGLFIIEAVIFYHVVAVQIAPFYPPYYDQASYYFGVYELVERIRSHGWITLALEFAPPKNAFGATLLPQGALLALAFGVSRTSILSLNFLHFIALELALFEAVRRKTNDVFFAWLSIALLLPLTTIFSAYGGIYDFRVDFSAFCLYGIWTCALIWSGSFRYLSRSILVAVASIALISLRFITVAYVALVFGGIALAIIMGLWRGASAFRRGISLRRLRNILVSGVITAVVVGPLLIGAKDIIYFYYVVGHIVTNEKYVRAKELGLNSLLDHIRYYPKSVFLNHIGKSGLVIWSLVVVVTISTAFWQGFRTSRNLSRLKRYRLDFLTLALASVGPLVILTIDIAKSPVVGGIVVIPVLMMLILLCSAFSPLDEKSYGVVRPATNAACRIVGWRRISANPFQAMCGVGCMIVGLALFYNHGTARQHYMQRTDLEQVSIINNAISRYVVEHHIVDAKLSFDRVVDYLNLPTVRLSTYEGFKKIVYYDGRFGGILATPRDQAMKQIEDSDVIVLTDPLLGREAPYPMNYKIQEYWDEMQRWTEQNRVLLTSVEILGISHRVYVHAYSQHALPAKKLSD